jgi:hypothetical protein
MLEKIMTPCKEAEQSIKFGSSLKKQIFLIILLKKASFDDVKKKIFFS